MTSLISIVRSTFLEAIRSVNPPGRWKVLVVDDHSQKLLNSVLKQFDILEESVTVIESIAKSRQPQPQFEAAYIIMPTTQNIDRIIKDFSTGQQYAAAHLFFIEGLSEPLFERLASSKAEPFLRSCKELFINFWATEAQTFTVKTPESFFSLYTPPRSDAFRVSRDRLEEDLWFIGKCIANVCITLNEFPFIRYYVPFHHPPLGPLKPQESLRPPPPSEPGARWRSHMSARGTEPRAREPADYEFATKLLAFIVQRVLDEHKKANPKFPIASDPPRPRGTLFITDRCMDMMAPFIHEFTYQAMANDLLPISEKEVGTKHTYKLKTSTGEHEDKELSDADFVWTDVRHKHMRETIEKLMADFNKFLADNTGFTGQGAVSLNDMKDMLEGLGQYTDQRDKFSLHLTMAQECMAIFKRDDLSTVANVEQCCATGLTPEGKTPKTLVEEMVPLLDSRDITNANKVRIVALYIQHRDGVPDEDRRRLYQHARLTLAEQNIVNALVHFGVRISRGPSDKDIRKKLTQKRNNDEEYELSRFKPLLKIVIEDHVAGKLDTTLFPYVKDTPTGPSSPTGLRTPTTPTAQSLRSQKPAWHRARTGPGGPPEIRERVLVFVLGGMTYSETRECYLLSSSLSKDVLIGSTHTLKPKQFLEDLEVLTAGGVGSKSLPNGLRDFRGPRPYQEFYDEKYYIRETAAPPASLPLPPGSQNPPKLSPTHSQASSSKEVKKKRGWFKN